MGRRAELADFLRSRRARLQPADLGLRGGSGQRRVPGLRREELAALAGVSVDHYVRLEQGRALQFSSSVLDAVARALRLDDDERAHLYRLATPRTESAAAAASAGRAGTPEDIRPGLRRLLDAMEKVPAYVVGRRTDLLAWNRLAAALITDFGALPPGQRNMARLVFLDERVRRRYADWAAKAADVVSYLRYDSGRHPDDPQLTALVDELSSRSPEFRELWAAHHVRDKTHGYYRFLHPVAGELTLSYETLRLPDDPDQALITYTAIPGSASQASLLLLRARSSSGLGPRA